MPQRGPENAALSGRSQGAEITTSSRPHIRQTTCLMGIQKVAVRGGKSTSRKAELFNALLCRTTPFRAR